MKNREDYVQVVCGTRAAVFTDNGFTKSSCGFSSCLSRFQEIFVHESKCTWGSNPTPLRYVALITVRATFKLRGRDRSPGNAVLRDRGR